MDNKKQSNLSYTEWDTCWMAIRYAMGRKSISSATLPAQLIETYWNRWTDSQKLQISNDLQSNVLKLEPKWLKFMAACNINNHFDVKLSNGDIVRAFSVNDRTYPLQQYVENPYLEIYILDEDIVEYVEYEKPYDIQKKSDEIFENLLPTMNDINQPRIVMIDELHAMHIHLHEKNGNWTYDIVKIFKY